MTITSPYLGDYYNLIEQSTFITSLTAKIMTVNIVPIGTMIVNSRIGIQLQITLPDTINQNDQFRITFPI